MYDRESLDPVIYADVIKAEEALLKYDSPSKYYKYQDDLGRPFELDQFGPFSLFHEDPQHENQEKFFDPLRSDYSTQTPEFIAEVGIQTPGKFLLRRNMIHKEGGFSRLIKIDDEDRVNHFKNLYEKQPFIERMPDGLKVLETYMVTSSFINLFALPLEEYAEEECFGAADYLIRAQIKDPWKVTRSIVDLSWEPEREEIIAAAYANHRALPWEQYNDRFGYIWNIRNTLMPTFILDGGSPLTVLEFNNMEPNEIAACTINGQVGLWDMRADSEPVWLTDKRTFYDVPTCLQWSSPITGHELTAAGLDGQILWYDMRNRSAPFDRVTLDMSRSINPKWENAVGVTSYYFEPNIPTKFLAGTTEGTVILGNKKGKNTDEKIGKNIFQCHNGPILSVSRNPKFIKYFLTVGDWLMKIWCDEYTNEPIYWTDYDSAMITSAVWSKIKNSVVLMGRDDGQVDLWDYLEKGTGPRFSIKISDSPIRKVIINDFGEYSAAGADDGSITIMRWTRHFGVFNEDDIAQMSSWLEREIRRERLLEIKLRETLIKKRAEERPAEAGLEITEVEKFDLKKAVDHYNKVLTDIVQKRGEKLGLWEAIEDKD